MKKDYSLDWFLALIGGLLLAVMLDYNGLMAKQTSPLLAACVLHGVGTIASILFIIIFSKKFAVTTISETPSSTAPFWAYLGGIPGALGIILAAITVNSSLGLSGGFALMLLGQIIFGIISDIFGLFGNPKRKFMMRDLFVVLCVFIGCVMVIFFRS